MKRASFLYLSVLLLVGLQTGCINTKPRPMYIPCAVSQDVFVERCTKLLTDNGYKIIEANPTLARVRATKAQSQYNQGENMQYNGPYLFDATYTQGSNIIISVATTIRVYQADETPFVLQTHNESRNTSSADKKYFVPILNGLRKVCAQP
ncbi:hypothetical protein F5984_21125 [Rudanella paleaurantiibacter]|uniref:Uncharacterized protein n=1 Tax=Rudanella paleaurantiibacter TaxID=2614655 RepID=A0A7J5TU90_9BACT|nr:hypothetical protein [Rudanella paleaurantiibacter]KAB7727574.1 hypothetical protein F5984_21125 [Rudanella paleaurantiibacter]